MHYNEIIDAVTQDVVAATHLTDEQVKRLLVTTKDAGRKEFAIYMNSISDAPKDDAARVAAALAEGSSKYITDPSANGTQVTFGLNKARVCKDILRHINTADEAFGTNTLGRGLKAIIDFSSPNIAKRFHVGHFRTTVLGNFITKLLRACGYETVAFNYLGDWGKQFGLVLLGFERYGCADALENDPLMHLFDVYVRIQADAASDPAVDAQAREIFRKMEEERHPEYMAQWQRFRDLSIAKYKELYAKLNVEFDVYSGESLYEEAARRFAAENPLCTADEDGSRVIACGALGNALIQKSDGTTLYLARDIVSALDRMERLGGDRLFYVVASEQDKHFQQLFECLRQLGYDPARFRHINYGLIRGMSTRAGRVHFLEDVLTASARVVREELLSVSTKEIADPERTAMVLAVSALLATDFGAKRIKGYEFNPEERARCENGPGAYLQYTHCRLRSIEDANAELDVGAAVPELDAVDVPEVHDLAFKLLWFEHVVELCHADFEPSRVMVYLADLARNVNGLVTRLRVKGEAPEVARARLYVLRAARVVLRNALRMLGMTPLERM